jgi:hypothetical protein
MRATDIKRLTMKEVSKSWYFVPKQREIIMSKQHVSKYGKKSNKEALHSSMFKCA